MDHGKLNLCTLARLIQAPYFFVSWQSYFK